MSLTFDDGVAQADGPPGGWIFTAVGDAAQSTSGSGSTGGSLSVPTANGSGGIYASQTPDGFAYSTGAVTDGSDEVTGGVWPLYTLGGVQSSLIEVWVNGQTGPADTNMRPASGPATFVGTLPSYAAASSAGGWALGLTESGTIAFTYVTPEAAGGGQTTSSVPTLRVIDTGVPLPNQAWSCLQVGGTLNGGSDEFGIYLNGALISQGGSADIAGYEPWVPPSAPDAQNLTLWIGNDPSGAGEAGALIGGVLIVTGQITGAHGPGGVGTIPVDPTPYTAATYASYSPSWPESNLSVDLAMGFGSGGGGGGEESATVAVEPSAPTVTMRGVSAVLNSIAAFMPMPTLSAWQVAPAPNSVALIFPLPVMKGSGGVAELALPIPTVSIQGVTGTIGRAALTWPLPHGVTTTIEAGVIGSVSVRAPMPELTVTGALRMALVAPTPVVSARALQGVVGRAALGVPMPALGAQVLMQIVARASLTAPMPQLTAGLNVGAAARVNATLARFALAARGATGIVGRVAVTMPVIQLEPYAVESVFGGVELTLPALVMQATGMSIAAAPTFYPALVMQTETQALTQYDDYPFNSFAAFNGAFLAASEDGVFVLAGDTDNGTLIQACARVGMTDFETSHLKRVDRCYVGYRASGDMVLRVICDETDAREYRLADTHESGLHGNHVRIGRGLYARYWQFELENRLGSDFSLDMIELEPTKLRRRRGGGDA